MFSKYFDHTILKADATEKEIINLCEEAKKYNFASVCVNPCYVKKCVEILKESDLRMSSTTGSAVSILGGLILGDAAVSAGIVSPIMIIIIAISSIAALIFPTVELVNAIRFYKILLLFLAALFGIYGVFLGTVYLLYHLFSMKSFNFSYLAPFHPFKLKELGDSFILKDNKVMQRNSYLTDNVVRGRK